MQPKIIGIDSFDGGGKDTIVPLVLDWLLSIGCDAEAIKFAGQTAIGTKIRTLLLDTTNTAMTAATEMCLFAADHAQTWGQIIEPADLTKVFITNRTWISAYLYQGYRGIPQETIINLYMTHMHRVQYSAYILLDLPYDVAKRRLSGRPLDRIENWDENLKHTIWNGYNEIPDEFLGVPVYRIDVDRPVDQVVDSVIEVVKKIMRDLS